MEYESVTHTTTDRQLGRLPSGTAVRATIHRYVGGPGPSVYVQAAQHGIELNGPAALQTVTAADSGVVYSSIRGATVVEGERLVSVAPRSDI